MSEQGKPTPTFEPTPDGGVGIVRLDPPVLVPGWHPDWRIHAVVPAPNPADTRVYITLGGGWPVSNTMRNLVPDERFIGIRPEFIAELLAGSAPTSVAETDSSTLGNIDRAPRKGNTPDDIRVNLVLFKPDAIYRIHDGHLSVEFFSGAPRTRVSCLWGDLPRTFGRSVEGHPVRYVANEHGEPVHYDVPGARWVVGTHPNMVKRARGAWVPGAFTGACGHKFMSTADDEFVATNLLVMDVDAGDPHGVAKELEQYAVVIHSTYKHTRGHPRCRVIFLLAAPCRSARDYNKAERFIAEQLSERGFFVPPSDSTLGRLAFLPMHAPGVEPVYLKNNGRPLDLAPLLSIPDPPEQHRRANREAGTAANALVWARRKVELCPPGRRHTTLYATAAWLAEATLATDDEIMSTLLPAALAVAIEGEGARSKKEKCIHDGIARGRGKP